MSALLSIILAMLLCPDVQRKAHAELDRVVGRDRFPEFSDQAAMPYLTAICKEVRVATDWLNALQDADANNLVVEMEPVGAVMYVPKSPDVDIYTNA